MFRAVRAIKPVQPYPAIFLQREQDRVLVVADLHLGWEALLAQRGIHIPSQTSKLLDTINRVINACQPTQLIVLGDVKDAVAKVEWTEWQEVPRFFETLLKKVSKIQIVPGNHDGTLEPLLPEQVQILPSSGMVLGNVGLFHGHAWPAPELLGCRDLIMGHIHPVVTFQDPMGLRMIRQVWVKATCNGLKLAQAILKHRRVPIKADPSASLREQFQVNLQASRLVIMPSFNAFLGGKSLNAPRRKAASKSSRLLGPLLRSECINLRNAEAYLLDGTFLGTLEQLRTMGTNER